MQVAEAYVVNTKLEVFSVLHYRHRVVHDVEGVCKSTLKLLFVRYHDPVSHDSPPSAQLR